MAIDPNKLAEAVTRIANDRGMQISEPKHYELTGTTSHILAPVAGEVMDKPNGRGASIS